ncbi:hypothetical protein C8F04DRAFT_1266382 [Mycena alexandri]|uniref:Uncharacterized protein n=1 Tax=Mycena alexandri TaxID=1745969 RepID=A0AAD6SI86_9AGAR|nr:hypothetical protein C8F04DRAFT_1266382 [Mycena alexandri]
MCFNRLPPEVADGIFREALHTPSDLTNLPDATSFIIRRTQCAQVCRAWWVRIVNMPWIWNVVWFYRFMPLDVLLFCLRQTKARPFGLIVDSTRYNFVPIRGMHGRARVTCTELSTFELNLISVLSPHFIRVHQLRLRCESYASWTAISSLLLSLDGQNIHCVHVVISNCERNDDTIHTPNNWRCITKLKSTGVPLRWGGSDMYRTVTTLAISQPFGYHIPTSQVLDLLRDAPSLIVLEIAGIEFIAADGHTPTVTLPFLTHFHFVYRGIVPACISLLAHLQLPSLQRLRWNVNCGDLTENVAAACLFFRPVRHLELAMENGSVGALTTLGRELRSLVHLDLRECEPDAWESILAMLQHGALRWPYLQTLCVGLSPSEADARLILDALTVGGATNPVLIHGPVSYLPLTHGEWKEVNGVLNSRHVIDTERYIWDDLCC